MSESPFTPVPVRARRDGRTPERQRAFIAALAECRCIAAAARVVGRSFQTAYRLRARPVAASFAAAWYAAIAGPDLARAVTGRAIGGVATPIRYRGRQVGERRRYHDRLALYIFAIRRPARDDCPPPHRRDPAAVYAAALAALQADLSNERCVGDNFANDVTRGSSPSAPRQNAVYPSCRPCAGIHPSFKPDAPP